MMDSQFIHRSTTASVVSPSDPCRCYLSGMNSIVEIYVDKIKYVVHLHSHVCWADDSWKWTSTSRTRCKPPVHFELKSHFGPVRYEWLCRITPKITEMLKPYHGNNVHTVGKDALCLGEISVTISWENNVEDGSIFLFNFVPYIITRHFRET